MGRLDGSEWRDLAAEPEASDYDLTRRTLATKQAKVSPGPIPIGSSGSALQKYANEVKMRSSDLPEEQRVLNDKWISYIRQQAAEKRSRR